MDSDGGSGGATSPPAPTRTKTLTCHICIEPIVSENQVKFINPNKCDHPFSGDYPFSLNPNKCDHSFCSDCLIKYIQAKLDDNIAKIRCPALDCNKLFEPLTYRALISPQNFVRWCDLLCESTLRNMKTSYCPNKNCLELIVDECGGGRGGDGKPLTKTDCPRCKKPFCFRCIKSWHAGFSCKQADHFPYYPLDHDYGVLVDQWQKCPGCGKDNQRVGGCSLILCECGVKVCYKCGSELVGQRRCRVCEERTQKKYNILSCLLPIILLGSPFLLLLKIINFRV